eukprot:761528-Hanusia_phi.AAC.2
MAGNSRAEGEGGFLRPQGGNTLIGAKLSLMPFQMDASPGFAGGRDDFVQSEKVEERSSCTGVLTSFVEMVFSSRESSGCQEDVHADPRPHVCRPGGEKCAVEVLVSSSLSRIEARRGLGRTGNRDLENRTGTSSVGQGSLLTLGLTPKFRKAVPLSKEAAKRRIKPLSPENYRSSPARIGWARPKLSRKVTQHPAGPAASNLSQPSASDTAPGPLSSVQCEPGTRPARPGACRTPPGLVTDSVSSFHPPPPTRITSGKPSRQNGGSGRMK